MEAADPLKKPLSRHSPPQNTEKAAPIGPMAFLAISLTAAIAATVYFYPRFLISRLGENSPWLSYLYTYGMGGIVFVLSALWIFTRKNRSAARKKEEQLWLIAIVCGLGFSLLAHGLWIFLAISSPVKQGFLSGSDERRSVSFWRERSLP